MKLNQDDGVYRDPLTGDVREGFCGACGAIPLALMGAGAASYGLTTEQYKQRKKYILIGALVALAASAGLYFYFRKCSTCKKK